MNKRIILLGGLCLVLDIAIGKMHSELIMGWIPIAMAAVSAASAIYGAVKSSKENKKNQGILNQFGDENRAEYTREYNRGALENPGAKAYLKRLDQSMADNTKVTENTAVSTGATHENVLAAKQSNNRVASDAISGLVEREDGRQAAVKQGYLQRQQSLMSGQMGINSQKGQNWAQIAGGISNAAGAMGAAYANPDGGLISKQTPSNISKAPSEYTVKKFHANLPSPKTPKVNGTY